MKKKRRSKTVIISSLYIAGDKPLLNSTFIPTSNTDVVNIAIIDTDTHCANCNLKKA